MNKLKNSFKPGKMKNLNLILRLKNVSLPSSGIEPETFSLQD